MLLFRVLILVFLTSLSSLVFAQEKVATVSPLSYSFAQAMLDGTDVRVDYLPPKRLPMSRIPSWLNKNQTTKFDSYDAFVTISSVLPSMDFFSSLRQTNIRIVEIDIANAKLPKGEKVALHQSNEYFWLNNNNLLLMLGVLKRDLTLLWPEKRALIEKNYQALSAEIRRLNLKTDSLIQEHEVAFLVAKNARLMPIGTSLSSDFVSAEEAQSLGLRYIEVSAKKSIELASVWKIDDFTRVKKQKLVERLQYNLAQLSTLLKN